MTNNAYKLSDFTVSVLTNANAIITPPNVEFNLDGRFILGAKYAITFDPAYFDLANVPYFTLIDNNGNSLKSNNSTLFLNATSGCEEVKCTISYIVYKKSYTAVYFIFGIDKFEINPSICFDLDECYYLANGGQKVRIKNNIHVRRGKYYTNDLVDNLSATNHSNKHIITDKYSDLDSINLI